MMLESEARFVNNVSSTLVGEAGDDGAYSPDSLPVHLRSETMAALLMLAVL